MVCIYCISNSIYLSQTLRTSNNQANIKIMFKLFVNKN